MSRCKIWHEVITVFNANSRLPSATGTYHINGRPIIITIIGSTALGWPWPPQANVASDLYPGHPPANFYNSFLVSSSTPSIQFDFGRPRPRLPLGFVHNTFLVNSLSSIHTTWPAHLSLLAFIIFTTFCSL